MGDGVAERTKADAGSKPRSRVAFFFGKFKVSREQAPPSPTRAWQIPTSAHLKICQKLHTRVHTYCSLPHSLKVAAG